MKRPEPRAAYSIESMGGAYPADDMDVYIAHLEHRLEAAESKLADIEKQQREPVAVVDVQSGRSDGSKFALIYTRAGHALADDVYNLYIAPPAPEIGEMDRVVLNGLTSEDKLKLIGMVKSEIDRFENLEMGLDKNKNKSYAHLHEWFQLNAYKQALISLSQHPVSLPDENRVAILERKLENAERERDYACQKLKNLENQKPDIMVSSEGAEAIRAIINKEMSMASRFVSFKRPSGINEKEMMGLFIRPLPKADE